MIVVHGFYADWAEPTYKMVRAGLMVVAFIEIFPRLPGSNSQFFGGISVFVGALVTIGSSGAIGNIMAGVVLIYTRAFQLGQTVAIGDDTGTVVEKNLLVTRLRTPTNEEVTIPNGVVLAKSVTNYSAFAKTEGLALRVAVNLGYAVDWRQAHELLLAAAQRAPDVLESPRSFVLQHSLDASSVKYVLSAYIDDASRMVTAQSDLHRHVLDAFREAGVEIMSPPVSVFRTEAGTATSGPPPHGS